MKPKTTFKSELAFASNIHGEETISEVESSKDKAHDMSSNSTVRRSARLNQNYGSD